MRQAEMQNQVIKDLSARVGSAGNLIEKIKKVAAKGGDAALPAINALITKFESTPLTGRGADKETKRGKK